MSAGQTFAGFTNNGVVHMSEFVKQQTNKQYINVCFFHFESKQPKSTTLHTITVWGYTSVQSKSFPKTGS